MKYAVKFFSDIPNPEGVPGDCVAIHAELQDSDPNPSGYTIMTAAEYSAYQAIHQPDFDSWMATHDKPKLILKLRDKIDDKTDELIAAGFTYDGKQFKLDLEHQNSYMFDYLLNQSYPHTIKGVGDDYITFDTRDAHTLFIASGFGAADSMIREGWDLKDGLDDLTYDELLVWVDPRTEESSSSSSSET